MPTIDTRSRMTCITTDNRTGAIISQIQSSDYVGGVLRSRLNNSGPKPQILLPTPYAAETQQFNGIQDTVRTSIVTRTGSYPYANPSSVAIQYPVPEGSTNAGVRALANLGKGSLDLGVALAEAGQTANMLVKSMNRMANFAQALRKGNYLGAADQLGFDLSRGQKSRLSRAISSAKSQRDNLSNGWLEYQYGWKPLMSDLHGAVEALRNGQAIKGRPVNGRSTQYLGNEEVFNPGRPPQRKEVRVEPPSGQGGVRERAGFRGKVLSPLTATLNQLGLLNPLAVAWEKVPFSFVVDWFFPVGTYLNSLTATRGLEAVFGWKSRETKWDTVWRTGFSLSQWGVAPYYYRSLYTRAVVLPQFSLEIQPRFNALPFQSNTRIANAGALLSQAFFSSRKF